MIVVRIIVGFVAGWLTLDAIFGGGPVVAWAKWIVAAYFAGPPGCTP